MVQGFRPCAVKTQFSTGMGIPIIGNLSNSNEINLNTVKKTSMASLEKLNKGFFRVRFDRRRFLFDHLSRRPVITIPEFFQKYLPGEEVSHIPYQILMGMIILNGLKRIKKGRVK